MVRHSSVSLSMITFSTQNILKLYFNRLKVLFWFIIGALFIVTVACHLTHLETMNQFYFYDLNSIFLTIIGKV